MNELNVLLVYNWVIVDTIVLYVNDMDVLCQKSREGIQNVDRFARFC